jgi:hypothetical protein
MARAKQTSKRKHLRKTLPAMGAAGVSLAMAGGASATAPTAHVPAQDTSPQPFFAIGEEELSDVSLATFYVFDKESTEALQPAAQVAWRGCRGCGCRGCGCRACRACRCGGCAAVWIGGCGCGGCGCGCCLSWGRCRWC